MKLQLQWAWAFKNHSRIWQINLHGYNFFPLWESDALVDSEDVLCVHIFWVNRTWTERAVAVTWLPHSPNHLKPTQVVSSHCREVVAPWTGFRASPGSQWSPEALWWKEICYKCPEGRVIAVVSKPLSLFLFQSYRRELDLELCETKGTLLVSGKTPGTRCDTNSCWSTEKGRGCVGEIRLLMQC